MFRNVKEIGSKVNRLEEQSYREKAFIDANTDNINATAQTIADLHLRIDQIMVLGKLRTN